MSFSDLGLHADLLRGVTERGFTQPTPIQHDAIPPALQGKDLLACAMTGSGKTAAFLLPIVNRLIAQPRGVTRALVLSPTRELAAQIAEDVATLAKYTPVRGAAVFGGVGMGPQEAAFRRGVDIIVATPGRLLDHFRQSYAKLDHLEVLVLDEADRMLDMGFLPDVKRILQRLPTQRQTLFFSATMPKEVAELSRAMLKSPIRINVERQAAPAGGITQAIYPVPSERKAALLLELLKRDGMSSTLIFTRTKHRANRLAEYLSKHGVAAERIHGQRSQAQRTLALDGFKRGKFNVLVATDIAARGIDVTELGHVINFDVPAVPEDYIHRVGRTARAGATGHAFTFVSPDEENDLRAIERAVGKKLTRVTLPDFSYAAAPAAERLEVPLAERIAAIRARKAAERARAKEKAERRGANPAGSGQSQSRSSAKPRSHSPHPQSAPRSATSDDSPYASSSDRNTDRNRSRSPNRRGRGKGPARPNASPRG